MNLLGDASLDDRICSLWHSRRAIRSRQETSQQGDGLSLQQLGLLGSSSCSFSVEPRLSVGPRSEVWGTDASLVLIPLSCSPQQPEEQVLRGSDSQTMVVSLSSDVEEQVRLEGGLKPKDVPHLSDRSLELI